MAQNGISINLLSDVREAVRGADNTADAMEQIADVLRDIANEGGDTTDRMERDFRDLSRTADRESDQLRDKFRQVYRDVKRDSDTTRDGSERNLKDTSRTASREADDLRDSYRNAYRDVARSSDDTADIARKNTRRMAEQSQEVGQEVRQNLGEGIANAARGDFEALGDTIGDTFGGAVAGIGGVATAAVAAAGALGIGAITAAFREAEERRKKLEERANDLAKAYIDAGSSVLDTITLAARISDVLTNEESRKEAEEFAKVVGVDLPTAARVLAGDTNALSIQQGILSRRLRDVTDKKEEARDNESVSASEIMAIHDQENALYKVKEELDKVAESNTTAAQKARDYSNALLGVIDDAEGATTQVDKLGNKLITLPKGEQIVIEARTGQATTNIDRFKGDVAKIPKKKAVVVEGTVDLSAVTRGIKNYRPPTVVVPANVIVRTRGRQLGP